MLTKAMRALSSGFFITPKHMLKQLLATLTLSVITLATQAAPVGGEVIAGSGRISQFGNTTRIHQQSQTLSLNWQQFDIAERETVNFSQPGVLKPLPSIACSVAIKPVRYKDT